MLADAKKNIERKKHMILLIDNYDSFSYNLYQYLGELTPDVRVIRNDEKTVEEIREMKPSHIIISPGPGRPENAGVIIDVVKELGKDIPILGVCLGHQAICEVYGATVTYASRLMHGKQSVCSIKESDPIFAGLSGGEGDGLENGKGKKLKVARYHSLAAKAETMPEELEVIATADDDNEIMAVKHTSYQVYGLQFHPESILTPEGKLILNNFINK